MDPTKRIWDPSKTTWTVQNHFRPIEGQGSTCKKEAAHRAGGPDDAQHTEEGGRVLVGGHLFLVPEGQDNGRVKIQVNLKFSQIE